MTKLYKVIAKENRFGTYLTQDSQGNFVLEMKGEGRVCAFAPDELEIVTPYTVKVRGIDQQKKHTCSYVMPVGAVDACDLLLSESGNMYIVIEVDTKCEAPKGQFVGSVFKPSKVII